MKETESISLKFRVRIEREGKIRRVSHLCSLDSFLSRQNQVLKFGQVGRLIS